MVYPMLQVVGLEGCRSRRDAPFAKGELCVTRPDRGTGPRMYILERGETSLRFWLGMSARRKRVECAPANLAFQREFRWHILRPDGGK